jgi:hypothetical protein
MLKLVFSETLFDVYFRSGYGPDLIVFFAPMHWNRSASPVWGDALAVSLGLNAVFVVPKRGSWYPHCQMSSVLGVVGDYCRRYSDVILYGYSMGGYAALKYSRYLNASRVVAFSPQSSIEPLVCKQNDRRYLLHYASDMHDGMGVVPADVAGSGVFVFFDDKYGPDRFQVDLLRGSGVDARYVSLRGMSHDTILCLASSNVFSRMLLLTSLVDSGDSDIARFLMRKGRNSWVYCYNLVIRAFEAGHYGFVQRLCDSGIARAAAAGKADVDEFLMYKAKAAYMRGAHEDSFSICSGISSDAMLNNMAAFYLKTGDFSQALELMSKVGSLRQRGDYCRNVSVIHERLGDLDSALEFAELAISIEPESYHFHGNIARVCAAREEFGRAYDAAVIAARLSGGREYFVRMRDSLKERLSKLSPAGSGNL